MLKRHKNGKALALHSDAYFNLPIMVELANESYSMDLGANYFDSRFSHLTKSCC
tara:strand:+ start:1425 stop:1586 length:162 start_codon:yes stop_codon:yes gene_type:complete